jgi:hypothetical protein
LKKLQLCWQQQQWSSIISLEGSRRDATMWGHRSDDDMHKTLKICLKGAMQQVASFAFSGAAHRQTLRYQNVCFFIAIWKIMVWLTNRAEEMYNHLWGEWTADPVLQEHCLGVSAFIATSVSGLVERSIGLQWLRITAYAWWSWNGTLFK